MGNAWRKGWSGRGVRDLLGVVGVAALICGGGVFAAGLPALLAEQSPHAGPAAPVPGASVTMADRQFSPDDQSSPIGPVRNPWQPPAGSTATVLPCTSWNSPFGAELSTCGSASTQSPPYVDDRTYLQITAKLARRSPEGAPVSAANRSDPAFPITDRFASPLDPGSTPVRPAGAADAEQ